MSEGYFYRCDPKLNKECKKSNCFINGGECENTIYKEYALESLLKVGDYVRTKKGIAKYLGLGRDVLKHETNKGTYEHYYNQHLFDNYIFDVGHDYGDTLIYDEFNNIDKLGKVKENIIGLIEVGDLINKKEVVKIIHFEGDMFYRIELFGGKAIMNEKDIKSVVTKEQFENMKYNVKEKE